jgi:nicotinate (nicotinamide) nucleotide adenylyltransferase
MAKPRVGIFAGTFDPVHTGHLVFALQALKAAKLDAVYFLPERRPRRKPDVVHFGHRTAMLTRAIRPYPQLGLIELPDIYLNVNRTLPKLQQQFAGADLVFLMGSDAVLQMNDDNWPGSDLASFLSQAGLIIGLRNKRERTKLEAALKNLPAQPLSQRILELPTKRFSSSRIRYSFRHGEAADGLLASVQAYARVHWLYVSLAGE